MEIQLAKGVRDIPPEEKLLKNKVVDTLQEVFQLYGFLPLETPIIERYETLAAKFAAGESSDALKETFKLTDQGGRELGLRFDLTVPLCRFVAMNPNLKMPFKRYELGPVFRDGPIKMGRVRQFWQCDVDIAGSSSMLADAEILAVLNTAFKRLKLDVNIKVNNRKLLNGILNEAGIKNKEDALIALDKLDKIGKEGVVKELEQREVSTKQINALFSLIKENIKLAELKKKITDEEGKEGIQELENLFSYLKEMGIAAEFDVSLVRGLAYYTGPVFEAYLKKGEITSSLAGGGRYDQMIGNFLGGNRVVPATGVSFGIVPIMEALKKEAETSPIKVYAISIGTDKESLKIIEQLRDSNIPVSSSLGKKSVSKNLDYANAMNIPYVIIVGENELKKNKVLLKEMSSGTEQLLSVKDVIKRLKK